MFLFSLLYVAELLMYEYKILQNKLELIKLNTLENHKKHPTKTYKGATINCSFKVPSLKYKTT